MTNKIAGLKNESKNGINKYKKENGMASGKSSGTINYRRKLYGSYIFSSDVASFMLLMSFLRALLFFNSSSKIVIIF